MHDPGPPDAFARRFDLLEAPLRLLLTAAVACTVCVALWLLWVSAVILPTRDPHHVAMWRLVACGYLAYGALSWVGLLGGARPRTLRALVVAVSAVAVGLGLAGVWTALAAARTGAHFEGYLLLMGTLLCGHGLAAIGFALASGGFSPRRPAR